MGESAFSAPQLVLYWLSGWSSTVAESGLLDYYEYRQGIDLGDENTSCEPADGTSFGDGENPLCQWEPPLLDTSEMWANTSFWLGFINEGFC